MNIDLQTSNREFNPVMTERMGETSSKSIFGQARRISSSYKNSAQKLSFVKDHSVNPSCANIPEQPEVSVTIEEKIASQLKEPGAKKFAFTKDTELLAAANKLRQSLASKQEVARGSDLVDGSVQRYFQMTEKPKKTPRTPNRVHVCSPPSESKNRNLPTA